MKGVLKFLFNVIRNISLLIVIGLIGFFVYFTINKEAANNLITSLDKTEYSEENQNSLHQENNEQEADFQILGIEEPPLGSYKSKKFKIEIKGGFAYLRPSQIMYINSGNPTEIKTINDSKIETKMNLTELDKILKNSDEECFFRIKTAIINCNYVLQLTQESNKYNENYSYQYVVVMEDGERINISKTKADELFELLDNLTF